MYRASEPVLFIYNSNPAVVRTVCTELQCLYITAKILLPLWAVHSIQGLTALTVHLNIYYPYGPYGLYRAPVPVQYRSTCSTLWAISSLNSFSVCTVQLKLYILYCLNLLYTASVPVQYSSNSNPL